MTRLSRLRVRRSSPGRSHTSPQQQRVTYSCTGREKSLTCAIDRSTWSSPTTSLRMARPRSKRSSVPFRLLCALTVPPARTRPRDTSSSQVVVPRETARWVMIEPGPAPCQCRSSGGTQTTSPTVSGCGVSPCVQTQPVPAVTTRIWPALVVVPEGPRAGGEGHRVDRGAVGGRQHRVAPDGAGEGGSACFGDDAVGAPVDDLHEALPSSGLGRGLLDPDAAGEVAEGVHDAVAR